MITMLSMVALFIGTVLGMRFKVLILAPAIVICSVAILGVGIARDGSLWSTLLGIVSVLAALQMGYLAGSVIRFVTAGTRRSKDLPAAAMQRPVS
jgi:hypothetical protein